MRQGSSGGSDAFFITLSYVAGQNQGKSLFDEHNMLLVCYEVNTLLLSLYHISHAQSLFKFVLIGA